VDTVPWTDVAGIVAAVELADLVVLGGGGLFQDYWGCDPDTVFTPRHHGIAYYAGFPLLAAELGRPCALYAVGFGPLASEAGRSLTRAACERAGLVTVRDSASKALLVELGLDATRVHVTADPAFRLAPASAERAAEVLRGAGGLGARPRLGVALRHWDIGVESARWEEQAAQAIRGFLDREGGAAVFVPFQQGGRDLEDDVAAARRVRARLGPAAAAAVLDGRQTPAEKAAVLGACDVVLGMRLHSLVFALAAGVPSVAISYDPKVDGLLFEAGGERALEIGSLAAEPLESALVRAYARREETRAARASAARALAERAGLTARLALGLLEGPAAARPEPAAPAASPGWARRVLRRARGRLRGRASARAAAPAPPLAALAARIAASRGAVIFPPTIGWNVHLVQRPHHLARAFARAGCVAVFDSSNSSDDVEGVREVEPGVFLFRGEHAALGALSGTTLWTFPYNFHLRAHHRPGTAVVYDWIDDLAVFPHERALLERNHRDALAEATLVVSVARKLHQEARRRRRDALYLPNAVEFERFALGGEAPPPADAALDAALAGGRPVAGYYGALARWFDYALLEEVGRLRPDWTFLLIGPDLDGSLAGRPLLALPNVAWLGVRPYEALPLYLRRFDVATIPFAIDDITRSTSPLKLFEYFAGGKPVVTTPLPECAAFPEVRVAAGAGEFARALDAARAEAADAGWRARRKAVARVNSWDARVRRVLPAIARPGLY
jgi:polysaccharide pyruvyl transferase WcaK-like protein/glycosyltransferase involved in cell wall biosynthesis